MLNRLGSTWDRCLKTCKFPQIINFYIIDASSTGEEQGVVNSCGQEVLRSKSKTVRVLVSVAQGPTGCAFLHEHVFGGGGEGEKEWEEVRGRGERLCFSV